MILTRMTTLSWGSLWIAAAALSISVDAAMADKVTKAEKEAEKRAITEQVSKFVVGRWKWTVYKRTWKVERSETLYTKKGWVPRGTMEFTEDLQYTFRVSDPPNEDRRLDAHGTYSVSGGEKCEYGPLTGNVQAWLILSAADPKECLTRPIQSRSFGILGDILAHQANKGTTKESFEITQVGSDSFQMPFENTTKWLDENGMNYFLFERMQEQTIPAPAPPATTVAPVKPPVQIAIGMTEEEVIRSAGEPQAKALLGEKTIFRYETVIVTFLGGKVSDVSFR